MSSEDRFRKNQSMISTHHMSCNQSQRTNFYSENRPKQDVLLSYAHITMPKQAPKWNQSSTTWRHTSHKYSFSKDNRFRDSPNYYTDIIEPQMPSSLTSKSCTFGKGNKKPISTVALRNAKEKPAPDRYFMNSFDESPRSVSKGKTFGLGWKHYEKNFIKHRGDAYASFHTENNAPAKYEVREVPGGNKKKFTAYGRLKMYSEKMSYDKNYVPGPYHAIKERHLYGTTGMNQRNFSFGDKMDLSKPANSNPEAIYNIPGFCDKFYNIKHKSQRISSTSVDSR